MMSVGAEGVISVAGNVVPTVMLEMVRAAQTGDFQTAAAVHHRLYSMCSIMLGLSTNPIPVKAAMQMLGRDSGELRLPMVALDDSERAVLQETLVAFGLEPALASC